MCTFCDAVVKHNQNSDITQHWNGKKHNESQQMANCSKQRLLTIDPGSNAKKPAKAFCEADITFHKLTNFKFREFREYRVRFKIRSESSLDIS